VKTTWSFSAFSILVYYAITHLAALRLPDRDRRYPPIVAWGGLAACLVLAFFVPPRIWLAGLALIGLGFAWHLLARIRRRRQGSDGVSR
jgi:APA family basic amino acid/polyamine antiporter